MKPRRSRTAAAGPVPTVADELQQTRPFSSPAQEAMFGAVLTADRVLGQFTEVLAKHSDVTLQQYNVLRILRGAGPKGLPTLSIAERMVERAPGITRLIDRLEKKGWIHRERQSGDRRQVLCFATKAGLKLLERLDPLVDEVADRPLARLSAAELRQLAQLLDRLRASIA